MKIFDDFNFTQQVLETNDIVLVDFYATWCRPCHAMASILEKISNENGFIVGKINIDENSQTTENFKIGALPTLIFFKKGKEIKRLVGVQSEQVLLEVFSQAMCD